jgi:hypothetical protein
MALSLELLQKMLAAVMPTLTGKKKYTYLLRKVTDIIDNCGKEYPNVKFTYETRPGESIFDTGCQLKFDKFPYILSIQTNANHIGNDFCDTALVSDKRTGLMSYDQWSYSKYETNRYYDDELFEKHMKTIFSDLDKETYTPPIDKDDEEPSTN